MFANLKNGVVTIDTYRFSDAQVTTLDDLLLYFAEGMEDCLTATIDNYKDFCCLKRAIKEKLAIK